MDRSLCQLEGNQFLPPALPEPPRADSVTWAPARDTRIDKKSRIHMSVQKSHVFYILGSEAGDHQGQEVQGLDLV